ncbi:phosphatidate cytidylyltransferase [Parvibaculum lavamentivorans DS-1]|uniref:Phosphatidate cytidylyltransferase n=1 Tax=Parvibaculum lavamentivorans (strain DS-1 / DSM 13023 / NCIMB 13966) TaxID=402881 RepID=A7HY14_PARL1|nr:phosphatidate cytidylyltransferase [Parvibaculum lavamentivorans]ABS64797.1 phosphatidate cytidylyltransferase [Parvibaculum lavamentivorans DS-1]
MSERPSAQSGDITPVQRSDLRVRILSALVLAPVVLVAVWYGGWAFSLMLAAAAVLMAHEIAGLLFGGGGLRRAGLLAATSLVAIALASAGLAAAALAASAAGLAFELAARSWKRERLWPALVAYPYLLLPLVALIWLRTDPALGLVVVVWLLATVWAIDICAYFAGRFIGGPKLAPRISPKKTWAGLIGGMAGAVAVAVATSAWLGEGSAALLAVVAAVLAIFEQAGDFAESAFKRRAGVKDSGTLIPGHGGILDRVDGLIAVAVGAAALALAHSAASPAAGVLIWP